MSSIKIFSTILFISQLCACGILDPYIDRRRNPGTSDLTKLYSGKSQKDAPVICYNPFVSETKKLQKLADEECIKHQTGTHAEFIKKETFSCKVLLPSASFYKCVK